MVYSTVWGNRFNWRPNTDFEKWIIQKLDVWYSFLIINRSYDILVNFCTLDFCLIFLLLFTECEPLLRLFYSFCLHSPFLFASINPIWYCFFEPSVMRGHEPPHHNFVVIASMIVNSGTSIKFDVFYTMLTKTVVTSLLLRNYDVITCILGLHWCL